MPRIIPVSWYPPLCGWIKCNSDGSGSFDPAASGGLFCDSQSSFLGGFALNVGITFVLHGELLTAMTTVELDFEKGWWRLYLECGSTLVVHAFHNPDIVPWKLQNHWKNRLGLARFMRFEVSHILREDFTENRRSRRIVDLEGKKQQERERNLTLALEKNISSINNDRRKGKETMEVRHDSNDFNKDEESPIKKEHKSKELDQLISLIKVENYHKIVKQPMDFGTMRAKLHEDMYTNFNQFKAKHINRYAKGIFEALNADLGLFHSELSLNKRGPSTKQQKEKLIRTPRRVATKCAGRNNATHSTVPETEKRDKYWPPSKPLVAEVLNAKKPIIQLNENVSKYKESLLRFVKDLGPTAQKVAAKRLEVVSLSPVENVSSFHGPIQEPTNQLHLGSSRTSNTRLWNTSAGIQNMLAAGISSNAFACVCPTSMISGPPQPRLSGNRNNLPGSSRNPNPCLLSQSMADYSVSCMPSNNLTELLPLMHQPRPRESMYAMPSNNLTGLSPFPHRANSASRLNPLRLSPHGPVSQQEQNSSFLQMLLGGETNNYGGGGAQIGQPEEAPPQLPLDNDNDHDEVPDLELHL
ncbi:hypothetical protein JHK82_031847 [Glycine max]|nr:hypothetical protein JHK85_032506 [Glycine max]KAG4995113.1 hypothetical protein JHK86_031940 [Glycine max]KAG5125110.1 hypothetical protein JHK82_031847 [Glycine max]KAG5146538.1 hypothetical protein JHK84_032081 [Glycine max]